MTKPDGMERLFCWIEKDLNDDVRLYMHVTGLKLAAVVRQALEAHIEFKRHANREIGKRFNAEKDARKTKRFEELGIAQLPKRPRKKQTARVPERKPGGAENV